MCAARAAEGLHPRRFRQPFREKTDLFCSDLARQNEFFMSLLIERAAVVGSSHNFTCGSANATLWPAAPLGTLPETMAAVSHLGHSLRWASLHSLCFATLRNSPLVYFALYKTRLATARHSHGTMQACGLGVGALGIQKHIDVKIYVHNGCVRAFTSGQYMAHWGTTTRSAGKDSIPKPGPRLTQ